MRIHFVTQWSNLTSDRIWKFEDWQLPVPRKGESVQLWAKYLGEEHGLKLYKNSAHQTLCHFIIERVTYLPDPQLVELHVTLAVPVLKE